MLTPSRRNLKITSSPSRNLPFGVLVCAALYRSFFGLAAGSDFELAPEVEGEFALGVVSPLSADAGASFRAVAFWALQSWQNHLDFGAFLTGGFTQARCNRVSQVSHTSWAPSSLQALQVVLEIQWLKVESCLEGNGPTAAMPVTFFLNKLPKIPRLPRKFPIAKKIPRLLRNSHIATPIGSHTHSISTSSSSSSSESSENIFRFFGRVVGISAGLQC